jgi:hypothetical protein
MDAGFDLRHCGDKRFLGGPKTFQLPANMR